MELKKRFKNLGYNAKLGLIIGGIFVLILIVSIIVGNCTKKEPATITEENAPVETEYVIPSLPAYNDIKVDETPLMYDFIYGTLNWHNAKVVPSLSKYTVFMFCKDLKENKFYVSYNRVNDSEGKAWVEPVFGNAPLELKDLSDTADEGQGVSKETLTTDLKQYGHTKKEGNYEFSWIWYDYFENNQPHDGTPGFQDYISWNNINLQPFLKNGKKSEIQKVVEAGQGIETNYLRATETENIKKAGWDINNPFWDKVNYGCYMKSKKVKNVTTPENGYNFKGDYVIVTPSYKIMAQGKMVSYYFAVLGAFSDTNAAEALPDYGYQSIDEMLKQPTYISNEERLKHNESQSA